MNIDDALYYCDILGLKFPKENTKLCIKAIRKAYLLKSQLLHPDKNSLDPKANEKFIELKKCYEFLLIKNNRELVENAICDKKIKNKELNEKFLLKQQIAAELEKKEKIASQYLKNRISKRKFDYKLTKPVKNELINDSFKFLSRHKNDQVISDEDDELNYYIKKHRVQMNDSRKQQVESSQSENFGDTTFNFGTNSDILDSNDSN